MRGGVAKNFLSALGSVLEAVFYILLLVCLTISIAVTVRSFFGNSSRATEFSLKKVKNHTEPGMVFFGNQFSLHVCSNFKMRAGSTGFKAMLEGGKPCAYKSFSVVLNKTMIHQWAEHSLTIEAAESDFMSSINGLVQAEHEKVEENPAAEVSVSFNMIIVKGPSVWIHQDSIYMKVVSPAEETLHPFYVVNDFSQSKKRLEAVEKKAKQGFPLAAILEMEEMIREDGAVFRYTPVEALAMNSMFRENFLDEGKLMSSRITLEQTITTSFYSMDDWDCGSEDDPSYPDPKRQYDGNGTYAEYPLPNTDEESDEYGDGHYEYGDYLFGWGDQKYNYNDTVQKLCEELSDDQTSSETTFRWFDGIVVESNTYDTFDPWTIFSTLTSIILALDRIYTTAKRYKTAYATSQLKKMDPVTELNQPKEIPTVFRIQPECKEIPKLL